LVAAALRRGGIRGLCCRAGARQPPAPDWETLVAAALRDHCRSAAAEQGNFAVARERDSHPRWTGRLWWPPRCATTVAPSRRNKGTLLSRGSATATRAGLGDFGSRRAARPLSLRRGRTRELCCRAGARQPPVRPNGAANGRPRPRANPQA